MVLTKSAELFTCTFGKIFTFFFLQIFTKNTSICFQVILSVCLAGIYRDRFNFIPQIIIGVIVKIHFGHAGLWQTPYMTDTHFYAS
jgi:hypothetical protein